MSALVDELQIRTPSAMVIGRWVTVSVTALVALVSIPDPGSLAAQEALPVQPGQDWLGESLRPGDLVRLQVWRDPELNGDYPVDEYGTVTLPLIGPRRATNIPLETFRNALVADFSEELNNQDPVVTLLRRVRVLGEVRVPGLYHIDPTMRLGDVIALAQGANPEGKLNDIRIVRDGAEIRSDLDTTTPVALAVRSGDQIMVPKAGWVSRNGRWFAGGLLSAVAIVSAALIR